MDDNHNVVNPFNEEGWNGLGPWCQHPDENVTMCINGCTQHTERVNGIPVHVLVANHEGGGENNSVLGRNTYLVEAVCPESEIVNIRREAAKEALQRLVNELKSRHENEPTKVYVTAQPFETNDRLIAVENPPPKHGHCGGQSNKPCRYASACDDGEDCVSKPLSTFQDIYDEEDEKNRSIVLRLDSPMYTPNTSHTIARYNIQGEYIGSLNDVANAVIDGGEEDDDDVAIGGEEDDDDVAIEEDDNL